LSGISRDVPMSKFSAWRLIYQQDYNDTTLLDHILKCREFKYMAVGAKKRGIENIHILAMGFTAKILQVLLLEFL
jgi:hypothetical protein